MSAGLHGKPLDPRRHNPVRPYAGKRGVPPSVTTVLSALGGKNLEWGSAKETALFAVHHQEEWAHLSAEEAVQMCRVHFRGIWDGRAAMGTLVHQVNEAWTWDQDADLEELVTGILNAPRPPKIWQGREYEVAEEAQGYVDGLQKFWYDFAPITLATEEIVRHPHKPNAYIGQRDWTVEISGERWLLDIKTTAEQDAQKALYADSWRLQGAGYIFADELVTFDENGKEDGTAPNYPIHHFGVLHLRGDKEYTLYELQAGASEWTRFCQLVGVHRWLTKDCKEPAPTPMLPPIVREEVAV